MAESVGIKEIVNQVAIQVATAVMMVFSDANVGPYLTTTASHRQL